jgi:hypothetical protein
MWRYLLASLILVFCACIPSTLGGNTFILTVDNSRCQGTYRTLFIYRNNVILGQVQGEPRQFLSVPAGNADFKAAPTIGTSAPIQRAIRLEGNQTWRVCE